MPEFNVKTFLMIIGGVMVVALGASAMWSDNNDVLEPDGYTGIAVNTIYQDAEDKTNSIGYENNQLIIDQDEPVYFKESNQWQIARGRYFQEEVTFINVEGINDNTTVYNVSGIPENITQRLRGGRIYFVEGGIT